MAADYVPALCPAVYEVVHLFCSAVKHRHGKAIAFHVHDQILAHYGEADKAYVSFFHIKLSPYLCTLALPAYMSQTCFSSAGSA